MSHEDASREPLSCGGKRQSVVQQCGMTFRPYRLPVGIGRVLGFSTTTLGSPSPACCDTSPWRTMGGAAILRLHARV